MTPAVAVRCPNHLGDMIMALPMIRQVGEAHPGASVTLLAPAPLCPLVDGDPSVDRVIPLPNDHLHGLAAVMKVRGVLANSDYSHGYILPPSFGAASSFALAGVVERVGYVTDGRRLLLTKPLVLPEPRWSEHRSELYLNLLRRATGRELVYTPPTIRVADTETAAAVDLLSAHRIASGTPIVVVAVRAVAESRRWGVANYARFIRTLMSTVDAGVVLVGGPDDQPTAADVAAASVPDSIVNLAGKTTLRELAAILTLARVFVGNDSGPAHLAAAAGTSLVVLSGADDPRETSPISQQKTVLRAEHLECLGCVKNSCPLTGDDRMRCMRDLPMETVLEATLAYLRD